MVEQKEEGAIGANIMTERKKESEKLKQKLKEYDYVRFTMPDINGISRGKMMTARNAHRFVDSGTGIFGGKGSKYVFSNSYS